MTTLSASAPIDQLPSPLQMNLNSSLSNIVSNSETITLQKMEGADVKGLSTALINFSSALQKKITNEYILHLIPCLDNIYDSLRKLHPVDCPTLTTVVPASQDYSTDILAWVGIPHTPVRFDGIPLSPSETVSPTSSTIGSPQSISVGINPLSPKRGTSNSLTSPRSLLNVHSMNPDLHLVDVCVHASKGKPKDIPKGFTLLERTIGGTRIANVNKGGNGTKVWLGFNAVDATPMDLTLPKFPNGAVEEKVNNSGHKSTSINSKGPKRRPITSISVYFKDIPEEPPFGFDSVDRSTSREDGCLHPGSTTTFARQPYVCLSRDDGAPLSHIGLISRASDREELPPQWHEVKQTLHSSLADLSVQQREGHGLYLCFRPDVRPLMSEWSNLYQQFVEKHPDDTISQLYCKLLALFTAILYSTNQSVILYSFECMRSLRLQSIPSEFLNLYLQCICDATSVLITYFTSASLAGVLKYVVDVFISSLPSLSLETVHKIMKTCFLLRHEDKQHELSERMIRHLCGAKSSKDAILHRSVHVNHHTSTNATINESKPSTNGIQHDIKPSFNNLITDASLDPLVSLFHQRTSLLESSFINELSTLINRLLDWKPKQSLDTQNGGETSTKLNGYNQSLTNANHAVEHAQEHSNNESNRNLINRKFHLAPIDIKNNILLSPPFDNSPSFSTSQSQFSSVMMPQFHDDDPLPSPLENSDETIVTSQTTNASDPLVVNLATPTSRSSNIPDYEAAPIPQTIRVSSLTSSPSSSNNLSEEPVPVTPFSGIGGQPAFDFPAHSEESLKSGSHLPTAIANERIFYTMLCIYCKCAAESAPFSLHPLRSDILRRKQHALNLIHYAIVRSGTIFSTSSTAIFVLRRLILPALMSAFVSDSMDVIRSSLQLVALIWERYATECIIELGAIFDSIFIPYLDNPICSPVIKTAIIETLLLLIFKHPNHLIHFYMNFDNRNWKIFEKLVGSLAHIVEADGMDPDSAIDSTFEMEFDASVERNLRKQTLKLLVQLLNFQAQWIGVPNLSRAPGISSSPIALVSTDLPNNQPTQTQKIEQAVKYWTEKRAQRMADEAICLHASKLCEKKMKSGIKYLIEQYGLDYPKIANFLYSYPSLNKSDVGDIVGGTAESKNDILTESGFLKLREAYMEMLDFTGMTFDGSLRMYLCDSGFRLPPEAQKIERILSAFSDAYVRDNPFVFNTLDAAHIVAYALVMLNTDAHNPRLGKNKKMGLDQFVNNLRGCNGKEDFDPVFLERMYYAIKEHAIEWKEDVSASGTDSRVIMKRMYESNSKRAYSISRNRRHETPVFERPSDPYIVFAIYDLCASKFANALTARSNASAFDVETMHVCVDGLVYGTSIALVFGLDNERALFGSQLARIDYLEKQRPPNGDAASNSATSLSTAEEDVRAGAHLNSAWYAEMNRIGLIQPAKVCTQLSFLQASIKQRINYDRAQATLKRIQNDFGGEIILVDPNRVLVKEGKLQKVNNTNKLVTYHFMLFNDLILYASEGMNVRYKVHRVVHLSLCRLEDVRDGLFPYSFRIISPQKSFTVVAGSEEKKKTWLEAILSNLRQVLKKRKAYMEQMEKKHSAEKLQPADSPTPATSRTPSELSPDNSPAATPKLTSTTLSPTASSLVPEVTFSATVNSNHAKPTLTQSSSSHHLPKYDSAVLRRYSTFIGQSEMENGRRGSKPGHRMSQSVHQVNLAGSGNRCKLCIRPYNSLFRRRQRCKWCNDFVCTECITHKAEHQKRMINVCDACYGALVGMVGDHITLLTLKNEKSDRQRRFDRRKTSAF